MEYALAVEDAARRNEAARRRVCHVVAYRMGRGRYVWSVCTCPETGGRPDIARRPLRVPKFHGVFVVSSSHGTPGECQMIEA